MGIIRETAAMSDTERMAARNSNSQYLKNRLHPVESGKDGIWEWRKWSDGTAECWGHYTANGVNAAKNNFSGYYYSDIIEIPLPCDFLSIKDYQVNGGSADRVNFAREYGVSSDNKKVGFRICGHQSEATSVDISVYISVKGRWKAESGGSEPGGEDEPTADLNYDPTSENAQSGKAVAEAVGEVKSDLVNELSWNRIKFSLTGFLRSSTVGTPYKNTIGTTEGYSRTDIIPYASGDIYIHEVKTTGFSLINYYDKDINYIGSYSTITDGDVTIKQNNIPNGTKYIALSTKKEDTKNPFVVIGEPIPYINEKASYAFNSIPELREDIGFSITEPKEIGFLYASDGDIGTNQNFRNTGKVSLLGFTNLDIEAVISSTGALAVFYDKDGIIISTLTIAGTSSSNPSTVNIDLTESIYEDAEYVCVSTNFVQYPNNFHLYLYNSNSLQNLVRHIQSEVHYLNGINNDWRNKKWCVIGDSITEHNFRTEKNYHDYINEMTGISVVNKGISGTGYIANNPFYNRVNASDFPTDCDVITIMGGINDAVSFGSDIPIGDITDTTATSVCGGVNMVIDALEAKYPVYLPLGIVSPLPAKVDTSVFADATYPNQYALVDNCRAEQITEKVKQIAEKRGYPFLDLFHTSGLRPWNDTCKQSLFKAGDNWDADGLHPNANGHKKIVNKYFEFLKILIN